MQLREDMGLILRRNGIKVMTRIPFRCYTCGGDNHGRDCPSHQGGRLQIYIAQEA